MEYLKDLLRQYVDPAILQGMGLAHEPRDRRPSVRSQISNLDGLNSSKPFQSQSRYSTPSLGSTIALSLHEKLIAAERENAVSLRAENELLRKDAQHMAQQFEQLGRMSNDQVSIVSSRLIHSTAQSCAL